MQSRKLLSVLIVLAASATSYAAPLDIVGIKVGMPANEAIKVLKAHNPQLMIQPFEVQFKQLPGQKMLRHILASDPNRELVRIEIALQPGPAIVTTVIRSVSFKQGQEPTHENVLASLREKYGREAFSEYNTSYVFWHFDSVGRPVPKKAICDLVFSSVEDRILPGEGNNYDLGNVSLLQQRAQKCGSLVGVKLEFSANPQLITRMVVLVTDDQLNADRYQATTELLLRAAEQAKNQQIKDADKRSGPKL